jgi:hypothetical protein
MFLAVRTRTFLGHDAHADLSVTMLRGLLRWGREGLRKHAGVFCRVCLSLRGMGSETTHTLFSLPIPNILCQNSQMNRLLILPVLLLTLLVVTPTSSAEWDKGVTAYESGDLATALREFRPLAKQGVAVVQSLLGWMYEKGQGVSQDYKTAVKWYRLAAEQGDADAQYNLGVMYQKGQGVPQDYKTAVKWHRLAAKQGIASAQHNLGVMYEGGWGVLKDDKTAVKWYRLAAEQGDADAQYNLGAMYDNGQGVPQDNIYAHMWWDIAASSGDNDAVTNRDIVAKRMTPADLSTAQNLARECVRKKYKGC